MKLIFCISSNDKNSYEENQQPLSGIEVTEPFSGVQVKSTEPLSGVQVKTTEPLSGVQVKSTKPLSGVQIKSKEPLKRCAGKINRATQKVCR